MILIIIVVNTNNNVSIFTYLITNKMLQDKDVAKIDYDILLIRIY